MRTPPFSTAQRDVLLKLTHYQDGTWSKKEGTAIYESRALTDALCQALVLQGYLDEELDGTISIYTVNASGRAKAEELRAWL